MLNLDFLRLKKARTRPRKTKNVNRTSRCKNLELPTKKGSSENSKTVKIDLAKPSN